MAKKKIKVPTGGLDTKTLAVLSEGIKELAAHAEALEKRLGSNHGLISRSNFTLWRLKTELVHTNAFMAAVPAMLVKGFGDFNKFQVRALSLGTDMRHLGSNFKDLEDLPGGIDQAIESKFEMMAEGLDTNNKALTKNLVQAKLTGQDSQAMASMLRRMNVTGGLTLKQTSELASNMFDLNSNFGIQVDRLVNSMAGLEDVFSKFSIFGQGGVAAQTFQKLVAKFGPGSEALISRIIKNLTTGGSDTLAKSSLLGIQGFRSHGFNLLNDPALFEEMVRKGGTRFSAVQTQLGGGADPFLMFSVFEEMFGPMGRDMAMLNQLMEENTKRGVLPLMRAQLEYNASFQTLKDEILKPFYESALGTASELLNFFTRFDGWSVKVLQLLGLFATGLAGGGMTQILGRAIGKSILGKASSMTALAGFLTNPWGAAIGALLAISVGIFAFFNWRKDKARKEEAAEEERRLAELSRENLAKEQLSFWKISSESIDRSVQNIIFMRDIMTELSQHSGTQVQLLEELIKFNREISSNTERPLHRAQN